MKKKKRRLFLAIFIVLVVILISLQISKAKDLFLEANSIGAEIENIGEINHYLKKDYLKQREKNDQQQKRSAKEDIKANTAQILERVKKTNLKLIDFSSADNELYLNLSGNFNSLLLFINYLEEEIADIEIRELKLKNNSDDLFLFLKICQKS